MSSAQSPSTRRYGSGSGSCSGARYEAILEQGERRHPRADRGRERLAEERAERLVLPRLDVARAPVVDEHDAEDVVAERRSAHRLAQRAADPDDEPELELDVETPARPVARGVVLRRLRLAGRANDRRPADDDRAGATVVADRKVAPVREERLGVRTEESAEVRRVLERRVEVDVVGDLEREVRRDSVERNHIAAPAVSELVDTRERVLPGRASEGEERIERRRLERPRRDPLRRDRRLLRPRGTRRAVCPRRTEKTPNPTAPFTAAASRAPRARPPARRSCSSRSSGTARVGHERARRRTPNDLSR